MAELGKAGSIFTDRHFVYKSGKHGPHYINIDPLFPRLELLKMLCNKLGEPYFGLVDTVTAAATGGIPLVYLTALGLVDDDGKYPNPVWADKQGDDAFKFERNGFLDYLKGRRVLFVEDLLNAGDTTRKVVTAASDAGAEVVGVSVICNRGKETAETLGVPRLDALCSVDMQAFEVEDCPQCKAQVPIVADKSLGHGYKFQQKHPAYPGGFELLLAA